jgi:hypothetical protein
MEFQAILRLPSIQFQRHNVAEMIGVMKVVITIIQT